jgi:DNA-binding beta-propeller fold protein YncE
MSHQIIHLPWLAAAALASACAGPAARESEWLWPLPPEKPRLRYVESIRSSQDVRPASTLDGFKQLVGGVSQEIDLTKPYGVAARGGVLYVTDTILGRLLVFDRAARAFKVYGAEGPGRLNKPIGVAVDKHGLVYVTDAHQQRVVVYTPDGAFVRALGGPKLLTHPVAAAVSPLDGRLYVVDGGSLESRHHRVSVFGADGAHLFDFGQRGAEPGEFNFPTNLCIGRDGRVYVSDTGNFRVQVFDADGKFLDSVGTVGTALGSFARPKGVALDSEDHLYVVDAAFNNIQIFDRDKRLLLFAGTLGRGPGEFWLPAGLHIDEHDRIYVADQYNHRVQILQYLAERPGTALSEHNGRSSPPQQ